MDWRLLFESASGACSADTHTTNARLCHCAVRSPKRCHTIVSRVVREVTKHGKRPFECLLPPGTTSTRPWLRLKPIRLAS